MAKKQSTYSLNIGLIGSAAAGKTLTSLRLSQQATALNNGTKLPTVNVLDEEGVQKLIFSDGKEVEYLPTVFESQEISVKYNNDIIKMYLYDTAGQQDFGNIAKMTVKNFKTDKKQRNALCFVFDCTDRDSFDHLYTIIPEFMGLQKRDRTAIIVLANKIDLIGTKDRKNKCLSNVATQEDVNEIRKKFRIDHYIPISALRGNNIDQFVKVLTGLFSSKRGGSCKSK